MAKTFPLLLLATIFLTTVAHAEAQQQTKVPKIGVLSSGSRSASGPGSRLELIRLPQSNPKKGQKKQGGLSEKATNY